MKKWLIIIISSVVAIATAVTLILVFTLRKPAEDPDNTKLLDSARTIKIVQVTGEAIVTNEDEEIQCYKGLNLYDGDFVSVSKESTIVVKFDEDKYVYLGENTKIKIRSEGKDKFKTNVFVLEGVVLAELQNKLGVDEEFFLSSNNSVMAVRGTIFGLSVKTVGDEVIQSYSVYKGATELFVFDKDGNKLISGKLSDISNAKYELKIPKSHLLSEDEINNVVGKWLENVNSKFADANDANEKLDEVQITVSKPTKEDFEKAANIISKNEDKPAEPAIEDEPTKEPEEIKYSAIEYDSVGYFGEYDGEGHGVSITSDIPNVKITYKVEGETDYKETNDYLFYAPGSYRVYYKLEAEGYDTKEDYEVIYITKPTIKLTTDCMTYDNTASSAVLSLAEVNDNSFNKYNGVLASVLLANAQYSINGTDVTNKVTKVEYNKIIDNYIELVDGKNTINVTLDFDEFSMNVDVNFLFTDTREDLGYLVGALGDNIDYLGGNLYYLNSANTNIVNSSETSYIVSGEELLPAFGLDVQDLSTMLINYPGETIDSDITYYDGSNTVSLDKDKFMELNFLVFPTHLAKGFNDTVYVYSGVEAPTDYPSYSIKKTKYAFNPDKTPDGVLIDFIESSDDVLYSLDGSTFQAELKIATEGSHKVYYKVTKDTQVINGYEYITVVVGQGSITFDNLKFITNPVHIFSNDNNTLNYTRLIEATYTTGNVVSSDNRTITSLDDTYTVYSNMIKNANFYDSITNEAIEANVTINRAAGANFNYTVTAEGYDMLSGSVRFAYSELGELELSSSTSLSDITVTLPTDYTVSLTDVPTVIPSRVNTSMESMFINYQTYYSIDGGKTWSSSTPKITTAGTYNVYSLYCFVDKGNDATELVDGDLGASPVSSLAANGNFIIAIQNITVEE